MTHLFWNQSSHIEQGVYQILLPFDASVTGFSCQIGQVKIVRGRVEAKEDARREFDNAVRRGRAGGLVEQQAADIFRISLANIPANTKMRAKLSFMSLLKHSISNDREVFTLNVPAYIAPRYGEIPWGVQAVPPEQHFFSHRFLNLEIDLLTAEDLLSVDSPTHNIVVRRGGGQKACQTWDDFVMRKEIDTPNLRTASVQLEQGQASLDKDMVVNITTAISDHGASPHACLETHPTIDNHQALMLTLPSDYLATTESIVHDGEIIFVADRSGSMRPKIEYLKSALMFFIDGVPQNRPFNIWCFGNDCVGMWPRSKPLNEKTKQDAISYVHREFAADMGGTDLLPALMSICEARGGHTTTDLVVLTDGDVLEPEATISFVKQKRLVSDCTFRCFALGIGNFVSHELIEGMAGAGGGYAEVIASTIYGGWEDRVVAVLKAMLTSHASSICMELVWQTGSTLPPKLKQSPPHISSISPFLRNRIFILVDSGQHVPELEAVVLKIRGPDNDLTTKTVLPKRLLLPDDTIHKLAARALLGDLERGESWLHVDWQQGGDAEPPVRDEAISLGRQWSLVSRWTSLCAIEEHTFGVVDDIVLPEDTDNIEDALLQPRGVPSANNAGLLNVAQAADSAGESDLSDVESITDHNMQQDYTKDREDGSDRVNKSLNTALCSEPGNLYGGYHVIVRSPSDVAKQAEASPNLAHDWESMPSRKRSDLAGLSITNGHRPCSTFQMRGPRSRRVKRGLGSRSTGEFQELGARITCRGDSHGFANLSVQKLDQGRGPSIRAVRFRQITAPHSRRRGPHRVVQRCQTLAMNSRSSTTRRHLKDPSDTHCQYTITWRTPRLLVSSGTGCRCQFTIHQHRPVLFRTKRPNQNQPKTSLPRDWSATCLSSTSPMEASLSTAMRKSR